MKVTVVAAGVREEVARYRLPSLITLTRDNHHLLPFVFLPLYMRWSVCLGPGSMCGHSSTVWYGHHNARKKNGGKLINKCDIMWHWWLVTLVRGAECPAAGRRPPTPPGQPPQSPPDSRSVHCCSATTSATFLPPALAPHTGLLRLLAHSRGKNLAVATVTCAVAAVLAEGDLNSFQIN